MRIIISFLLLLTPWKLRRVLLNVIFGYNIHKKAKIGFSIILADNLILKEESRIGHFSFCKKIYTLRLGKHSIIGNFNWITGTPKGNNLFFKNRPGRNPSLVIGDHSAITHRHLLDCSEQIVIGNFSTIAGFRSQFLTHSIDLVNSRQDCAPIKIGDYCFIGTNCVFLSGSKLGNNCILGASSLLNKSFTEEYILYGGVPAIMIKKISKDLDYFTRDEGLVT